MTATTITLMFATIALTRPVSAFDVDSLYTGHYQSMIVVDPAEKRKLLGFCRLAQVYSTRFQEQGGEGGRVFTRALPNLASALREYTAIRADYTPQMGLQSRKLMVVPWIFLPPTRVTFSNSELMKLGAYLTSGGFLLVDAGGTMGSQADVFTRTLIAQALRSAGQQPQFRRVRTGHPIYHAYFDFDGPPRSLLPTQSGEGRDAIDYLMGVELKGRLAVVVSYQRLAESWDGTSRIDNARHLQFGINTIVYALSQEGGMTKIERADP